MTSKTLLERWKTPQGSLLAAEAVQKLTGQRQGLPEGFGAYEGRRDLRGLVVSVPKSRGRVSAGHLSVEVASDLVELRRARWEKLDLSHAKLPSLRFFESEILDCRFDEASCRDWRLWVSEVSDSSFGQRCTLLTGRWHLAGHPAAVP